MKILHQVKILWKRGEITPKEQFLLFSTIFSIYLKSPVTNIFVKCGCSKYFFLNSATLICRGTDISKYFRESLGIRDNESRLYFRSYVVYLFFTDITCLIYICFCGLVLALCRQNIYTCLYFGTASELRERFRAGKIGFNPPPQQFFS